jgi:hypothetical protein
MENPLLFLSIACSVGRGKWSWGSVLEASGLFSMLQFGMMGSAEHGSQMLIWG